MYVATSRGKTLGSKNVLFPTDSSIYWTGPDVSIDRIQNCKLKKNGEKCETYKKREEWVEHLDKQAERTRQRYTKQKLGEIMSTTLPLALNGSLIREQNDLATRITEILHDPNPTWKAAKKDYQLPKNYFD